MATKKQRINISASDDIVEAVEKLAKRDDVPVATKARELVEKALQIEEDDVLDVIASRRDKKSAQYIPHDKAWK